MKVYESTNSDPNAEKRMSSVDAAGLELVHGHPVTHIAWHGRGDYFATVAPAGNSRVLALGKTANILHILRYLM